MTPLSGKNAVVCGASKGIGRASAVELARLGANVTVLARGEGSLAEVVASLDSGAGQKHGLLVADYSDRPALSKTIMAHVESAGTVHILVNNTGGPPAGAIADADGDALLQAFSNHLLCNHLMTRAVVSGMKTTGFGRIINIISTSVIAPIQGLGVSNTIRAAVANWARTLAGELAPFGITVNNVLPGFTDTQRLKSILNRKAENAGVDVAEIERRVLSSIPVGRLGKPEELGAVVGFLASPGASYVTGVNLPVDGGRTAVQ